MLVTRYGADAFEVLNLALTAAIIRRTKSGILKTTLFGAQALARVSVVTLCTQVEVLRD